MRYFSMFSGIGGFEKGIEDGICRQSKRLNCGLAAAAREQSGFLPGDGNNADAEQIGIGTQQPHCVGYSEIDKAAIAIYRYHWPEHKNFGDATRIVCDELPDFDLLVGGFPCQAFSIAGKRLGFDDTRGTLFFEIARILAAKRPKHFLLENVKGLFSHDNGRTFKTIIGTLDELGYCVEWDCLNSKFYGVPQNRERVFIVGHLGGLPGREVFPIGDCAEEGFEGFGINRMNNPKHSNNRVYETDGLSPSLHTAQGGDGAPIVATRHPLKFIERNQKNIEGDYSFTIDGAQTGGVKITTLRALNEERQGNRVYAAEGVAATLTANMTGGNKLDKYQVENRIRRLTPLECERLQGFPDLWSKFGKDESGKVIQMSDSARYKALGNAVTVNVISAIIGKMIDCCPAAAEERNNDE